MASLLPQFERVETAYKTMNETPFPAAILVPNGLKSAQKTCPLLVHFHGGGLFMGTILEPFFLSRWPFELAQAENAIIVSPSYRLIPEATGKDILEDLKDFWEWARGSLPAFVAERWPGLTLDVSRIAVWGESAGGYLALQSSFLFPSPSAPIKVAMAQYCALYPDIPEWNPEPTEAPLEANAFIDAYLAKIKPGAIRLSSPFPELIGDLGQAMEQAGRHREWLADDERTTLGYNLRSAEKIPPLWIMQGTDDQRVPKEATDNMVAKIRKARPETQLLYSVQPGDHGFDSHHGLDEPYIAEGINFVRQHWP